MTDKEFSEFHVDPEVRAIVKAPCMHFDYRKLAIASIYLSNPDVFFLVSNDDPVFVSGPSGRLQPDIGATLKSIEVATDRVATRVGKPEPYCMEAILEDYYPEDK